MFFLERMIISGGDRHCVCVCLMPYLQNKKLVTQKVGPLQKIYFEFYYESPKVLES